MSTSEAPEEADQETTQSETDLDKSDGQRTFKERILDIQGAYALLKERQFYPFAIRLTIMSAMVAFSASVSLILVIILEFNFGEVELQTIITILFGVASASWLVIVPITALVIAFGLAIAQINAEKEELRPDWENPVRSLLAHLFAAFLA